MGNCVAGRFLQLLGGFVHHQYCVTNLTILWGGGEFGTSRRVADTSYNIADHR